MLNIQDYTIHVSLRTLHAFVFVILWKIRKTHCSQANSIFKSGLGFIQEMKLAVFIGILSHPHKSAGGLQPLPPVGKDLKKITREYQKHFHAHGQINTNTQSNVKIRTEHLHLKKPRKRFRKADKNDDTFMCERGKASKNRIHIVGERRLNAKERDL